MANVYVVSGGFGSVVVPAQDCWTVGRELKAQYELQDLANYYAPASCAEDANGVLTDISLVPYARDTGAAGTAVNLSGLSFAAFAPGATVFDPPSSAAMEVAFLTGFGLVFMGYIWSWALAYILRSVGRKDG